MLYKAKKNCLVAIVLTSVPRAQIQTEQGPAIGATQTVRAVEEIFRGDGALVAGVSVVEKIRARHLQPCIEVAQNKDSPPRL